MRQLTPVDLAILALAGILAFCFGAADIKAAFLYPFFIAPILIAVLHYTEHILLFRDKRTAVARVVSHRSELQREKQPQHRYGQYDEIVLWKPVVEYETESGTVTAEYSHFSKEKWFREDEEYRIWYSVKDPKRFYFELRKQDARRRFLLVCGISVSLCLLYTWIMIQG